MNIQQTTYEKTISSTSIFFFALAGFGPLFLLAWYRPDAERPLLFISAAMVVFALGLLHDAAEALMDRGRALYAAAIFCTIPAVSLTSADVSALPLAGLMMMVSVELWMVAHARGDGRTIFLVMLGVLVAAGGYLFLFSPESFAFVFAGWMATRSGKRPMVLRFSLATCFILGVFARGFLPSFLPAPNLDVIPSHQHWFVGVMAALPWVYWILPRIWNRSAWKNDEGQLGPDATVAVLLVMAAAWFTGSSLSRAMAAVAPMMALLAADVMHDIFDETRPKSKHRLLKIPPLLASLSLFCIAAISVFPTQHVLIISPWQAVLLSVLAVAVAATSADDLPRWSFALLCIGGVVLAMTSSSQQIGTFEPIQTAKAVSPWIVFVPAFAAAALWMILRRRFRASVPAEHRRDWQFGGESFRVLREGAAAPVSVRERIGQTFQAIIFGDVAGAESPLATSRGGYFVFRALARVMEDSRASFAISLGDLTSQSSATAYRRLHSLLGTIPLPLMVTPGNHDLFRGTHYDDSFFHETFGADNAAFQLGPVKFVFLNNGAGYIHPPQFEWLERVLSENPAPFTLLFCHKPPFDFRENIFYAMETREHADRLHDLLVQHKVDAVFSGHIHSLLYHKKDGVTYIISGGGGSKLVTGDDQYHYLTLDVSPQELVLRALPLTKVPGKVAPTLLELHFAPRT